MSNDSSRRPDDGPPFDPADVPETVTLTSDRLRLRLAWRSGDRTEIRAGRLRARCRCAWCTRKRIDGTFVDTFDDCAIERLAPIGGYAINIAFSDGHARGIYPWTYLRDMSRDSLMPDVAATNATAASASHDGPSP